MKTFGLTGGMGMGKSTASQILHHMGAVVVDTDQLARQLVAPGQPALEEIRAAFGPQLIQDGNLDRAAMASIVFQNPEARRKLENILHPRIRALWQAEVKVQQAKGASIAVVDIPLLFETGGESEFNATVCVACSTFTQMQRLQERGWSLEHIQQRIQAQLPVEKKMALATYVIWTEGCMEVYQAQWISILKRAGIEGYC